MKVWVVHRRVTFQLGDTVIQSVQAFDSEREANVSAKKRDAALLELLSAKMVDADGESLGAQVRELLFDVGITGIGHAVAQVTVTESSRIISPDDANVIPIDSHGRVPG